DLKTTVVSSIPAQVWATKKILQLNEPVVGYGRLLAEMPSPVALVSHVLIGRKGFIQREFPDTPPEKAAAGVLIILNAARNCSRKMLARVEGQAALEILEIGKTMFKPQRT